MITLTNVKILITIINIKLLIRLFANGVKRRPAPEDCDQWAAESEVGRQRVLWSLWLQGDSGGDLDDDHDHVDEGDDNVEPGAVEERGGARDPLEQGQVAPCEQGLLLLGEIHQNDQLPHLHIHHHYHHQDQQQFTKDYLFSV